MRRSKFLQSSLGFEGGSTENEHHSAKWLVALCCLIAGVAISVPAVPQQNPSVPQIEHFPATVGIAGKPISLEARVMAPGRAVVYLRLYYKSVKDQSFKFVDMRPGAHGYIGQIPGFAVRPPAVQYFLIALLADHTVVNHPVKNPYGQPFEVLIRENTEGNVESEKTPKPATEIKARPKSSAPPESKPPLEVSPQLLDKIEKLERPLAETLPDTNMAPEVSPEITHNESLPPILVLSPEPFSTVAANEVVIAASFVTAAPIDSASIKILLDGLNVTRNAEISPAMVTYTPAQIHPGEHNVAISARDQSGNAVGPLSWRFQVDGKIETTGEASPTRPVTGIVYTEMRREKFNGRSLNNTTLGTELSGNAGPLLYSASAYFTSLEDKTLQPRNRFVINAGLPWLQFTLGDATPYYDELILGGRRVRGLEIGLNTGWVNFDVITGETVRQVDNGSIYPFINPVTGDTTLQQRFGTYKQTLLGLRPSFGNPAGRGFLWASRW